MVKVLGHDRPTTGGLTPSTVTRSTLDVLSVHQMIRATLASAIYHTANSALLIPFRVARPTLVNQLSWYNGATVSGNVDLAIYDRTLKRLVSTGSTVQATINVLQTTNVTDTFLAPGLYFWGLSCDNITATFLGVPLVGSWRARFMGIIGMASAFVLPATIVSDTTALTMASLPVVGHTERSFL